MTLAQILVAASASVLGLLGGLHLLYTFHGDKLHPRDPAARRAMEGTWPVLTRQTTFWRAHTGFNATHGLGAVAFALVYGHLALAQPAVLGGSRFLLALGLAVLGAYALLAQRYFFSTPLRGMLLACGLYAAGWWLW